MTSDWRKIEAAIVDFLEREGLSISSFADTIADIPGTEDMHFDDGIGINITKLARELADLA